MEFMMAMLADAVAVDGTTLLGQIIQILVSGITGLATGIGNGLTSLVMAIFIDAATGTLSVFGIMIVVFAGISLAVGLSRWVVNWVTSLGASH